MCAQSGGATSFTSKTPGQGAVTSVLVGTSPLLEGIGGRYFEDWNEAGLNPPGIRSGVAAYAFDPGAAARLWGSPSRRWRGPWFKSARWSGRPRRT
jgi:hypothetical protein